MNTDDLNTFEDTLGLINTKTKRSSLVRHRDHMSINCDCYWITVNKKKTQIQYFTIYPCFLRLGSLTAKFP